MVLALRGAKTQPLVGYPRLGATIPAGLAALVGIVMLARLSSASSSIDPDNPFAEAMTAAVQPGIGLYLLILASIALVVVAWLLARPSASKNIKPGRRRSWRYCSARVHLGNRRGHLVERPPGS
jgi:hypothetical protein